MLTPPKLANDPVSGIENGSEGCIVESAMTICRKVQRFFGPTHANRWLSFSGKRTEQTRKKFAKGHFGKVVCSWWVINLGDGTFRCTDTKAYYAFVVFVVSDYVLQQAEVLRHRELYYEN